MIKELKDIGLDITEKEYRVLELLSYSLMSGLDREGPSSVGVEVKPTDAMLHGTIVDNMIDGSFDVNDYYVSDGVDIGDGLKKALDLIISIIKERNNDTFFTFTEIEAYKDLMIEILNTNHVDYYAKKPAEWVVNKIIKDKVAKNYFEDTILARGKPVITSVFLNNATKSFNVLKSHEFTAHLFEENVPMKDSMYQFKYELKIKGYKFKAMLDRIIIDHEKKIIYPYDLKTGGKPAMEFENSFFYWRYDLQALIYSAVCYEIRDEYFPDYDVGDFKFIYIGRYEHKPLIWNTPIKMLNASIHGFTRNGKKYKGLVELIKDFEWYVANSFNVDYPEEVYIARGEKKIDTTSININKD